MRDLAVVSFLAIMLILAYRKPNAGLALWIWTALLTPNYLVYGFASSIRFNLVAACWTIMSWLLLSKKPRFAKGSIVTLVFTFLFWTYVSTQFAIYESTVLSREFGRMFRGILLFTFALMILDRRKDFELVAWAIVLSIGFYSGVEGLKFINSGGTHHIFGPSGSNLRDNNHLALAMNMMIPFALYLTFQLRSGLLKIGFMLFLGVSVLAVIGTFSRGGFLGLAILTMTWLVFSRRKILVACLILTAVPVIMHFVPETYNDRIGTISEAEEDSSLAGRIVAWKQSVLIAMDNPLTGGGFYAVQTSDVWQRYAQDFNKLDFIESPDASLYNFKAAHSIYFQVLGDQGFVGFFLYLAIFFGAGLKAIGLAKKSDSSENAWISRMAGACLLSLMTFAVCGALLSLAYFELSFFIVAVICALGKVASRESELTENH